MNLEDLTAVDILDAAIDRLNERGWTQNEQGRKEGPNCLTGAVYWGTADLICASAIEVEREFVAVDVAYAALERRLRDKLGRWAGLQGWNDQPERTAEDVILLLKEARYELEAANES